MHYEVERQLLLRAASNTHMGEPWISNVCCDISLSYHRSNVPKAMHDVSSTTVAHYHDITTCTTLPISDD